jgi:hypothetical protein
MNNQNWAVEVAISSLDRDGRVCYNVDVNVGGERYLKN